jgi:hypothetical protein
LGFQTEANNTENSQQWQVQIILENFDNILASTFAAFL